MKSKGDCGRAAWCEVAVMETTEGPTFSAASTIAVRRLWSRVGRWWRPADDMGRLLAARENSETSPPAPPQGLYFVAADYPTESFADQALPPS